MLCQNSFRLFAFFLWHILFLLLPVSFAFSQGNSEDDKLLDSLTDIVRHPKNDIVTAKAYVGLSEILYVSNIDTVIPLCVKAIEVVDVVFKKLSTGSSAEKKQLLQIKSLALNNIGYVYDNRGNIKEALEYYLQGLKIREENKDEFGSAESFINVGSVYRKLGNNDKALEYYNKGLKISKSNGFKDLWAQVLSNMGVLYDQRSEWDKAINCYSESLKINKEIGDKKGIADLLNNIGTNYSNLDSIDLALEYYNKSLLIREEIGHKEGIAISLYSMAKIEFDKNRIEQAKNHILKSLELSEEIGFPALVMNAANLLYKINYSQNDWRNALEMYELYIQMRDSISNEEIRKDALKRQLQYEYEKRESEARAEQDKKAAVAAAEKKRQQLFLWFIIAIAVAVTVIAVIIYNSLHVARRQKKVIEGQKKEIEEKNKGITDSINYAKRIQQAKLPKLKDIHASLPQCFLLFKPKDIVSGDFYFFHKVEHFAIIAAADCTGHGVPGALMSMIGSERLNDAVSQTTSTAEILRLVNIGVKASLKQTESEESTRDGMDIALLSIELNALKSNNVQIPVYYSGANRPVWIIKKGDAVINEVKATKKAIGGLTDDCQQFESHTLNLSRGDSLYIFTDGYADQFNTNDKKLMSKKFKELLLSVQNESMENQKEILSSFIDNWKGNTEQTDDILVIGIRL